MHTRSIVPSPLWEPSAARVERANMTRFLKFVRQELGVDATDYASLYAWSIEMPFVFWTAVWAFCDVKSSRRWDQVVVDFDRMPGARWFPGATLSFAENLLRFRDDHPAIIYRSERGDRDTMTYRELYARVARVAAALRSEGVGPGDRVAGVMPNIPEAVIAMLAATSLGAVWASVAPSADLDAVRARIAPIRPKVVFVADGHIAGGERRDSLSQARQIMGELSSIDRIVVIGHLSDQPDIAGIPRAESWRAIMDTEDPGDIDFEQLPFDHPVYVLYPFRSPSGPRGIVHSAGGTLIQHLKEAVLHNDMSREDRVFYYTTCGWTAWNWLVSSFAVGATVVLYDGSPTHPRPDAMFQLAAEERCSFFGVTAPYLELNRAAGNEPGTAYDLSQLETIAVIRLPMAPELFDYVYTAVKSDVCLAPVAGRTDIISCFALSNPIGPVYRGEASCLGLGMKVEVFDERGRSVRGEPGALVCSMPFPSMPTGFWDDPAHVHFRNAYFDAFPGVWCHGDRAILTARGGLVVCG